MALGENFQSTITAARHAAPWAWAAIYRELAPQVTGYLRASGAPDPEDLTAEVFLRVVQDLGAYAQGGAFLPVIAHHRLVDERRRLTRRAETSRHLESMYGGRQNGNAESEAVDNLVTDEVAVIIKRCVPDQREVLLLRVVAGLTLAETAEALGKSLGAVKALQRRGVAAIARAISREGVSL